MTVLIQESDYSQTIELLHETDGKTGKKSLFIEGCFGVANVINNNNRYYDLDTVLGPSVERYISEYIDSRTALGEMDHPDYPMVKRSKAAVMIQELYWESNRLMGKAKVLENMPEGAMLAALLEEGYPSAMSLRALGKLKESKKRRGSFDVCPGLLINAIDSVTNPGMPGAYQNLVRESLDEWELNESTGVWVKSNSNKPILELDRDKFLHAVESFISGNK